MYTVKEMAFFACGSYCAVGNFSNFAVKHIEADS